jgi:hypothetical protein
MELCGAGHGEVCYSARKCPACEAIDAKDVRIEELQQELLEVKRERDKLKEQE